MFETCTNCSGWILTTHKGPNGTYCSAECLAWHSHPGFCQACLDATLDEPAGSTFSLNGIGTGMYGRGKRCPECGSVQQTRFICVLYVPLIPLKKYRVKWMAPEKYIGRRVNPDRPLALPVRPS